MRDKHLRPLSIRTVDEIYKNKKKDFFVEFHKYMTNENNKLFVIYGDYYRTKYNS